MAKRFSIIVPAYNAEKFIEKCIKSILNQTFENYEIIVVNDCSTDNTKEKLKKYEDKIKVIDNKKRKCAGGARNRGIEAAIGEYIILLDSDDHFYDKTVLQKLDNIIGDNEADAVYTGFEMIGSKEVTKIPTKEKSTTNYKIGQDLYYIEGSKCWNRKFIIDNNIKYPEDRFYEDVIFNCIAITKVKKFLIGDFILYTYWKGRKNSTTTKITFKHIEDNINNIKDLIELAKETDNVNFKESIKARVEREVTRCKERLEKIVEEEL